MHVQDLVLTLDRNISCHFHFQSGLPTWSCKSSGTPFFGKRIRWEVEMKLNTHFQIYIEKFFQKCKYIYAHTQLLSTVNCICLQQNECSFVRSLFLKETKTKYNKYIEALVTSPRSKYRKRWVLSLRVVYCLVHYYLKWIRFSPETHRNEYYCCFGFFKSTHINIKLSITRHGKNTRCNKRGQKKCAGIPMFNYSCS